MRENTHRRIRAISNGQRRTEFVGADAERFCAANLQKFSQLFQFCQKRKPGWERGEGERKYEGTREGWYINQN